MRPRHTTHPLPSFPVYSCTFLSQNQLLLGGGGGASRTGIKNKLRLYDVDEERTIKLIDEYELGIGEDAPMSMAAHMETSTFVCGVNSALETLKMGKNENCRVFNVQDLKIIFKNTQGTLPTEDVEDYQKVTVLSPDGTLLAVAGAHDLSLLSFPSLTPIADPIHTEKEIYDTTFCDDRLVVATTLNLLVYLLPPVADKITSSPPLKMGKRTQLKQTRPIGPLKLEKSVDLPSVTGGANGSTFRAVRYHPSDNKVIYTAINTTPVRSRNSRSTVRHAYICKWNTATWTVERTRKVGDRGLTCFDVSTDGRLLGFGSSDLTIGLLDAKSLNPCASILNAHDFPPTTIKFNPTSTLLITGSADNTVRIVSIPPDVKGSSWGFITILLLTLLLVLVAILAQKYLNSAS